MNSEGPEFKVCKGCGHRTAVPVVKCVNCGRSAYAEHQRVVGAADIFIFLLLVVMVGAGIYYFVLPKPGFVGAWHKDQVYFQFDPNHKLTTNGIFNTKGKFRIWHKTVTASWQRNGELLYITGASPDSSLYRPAATVQFVLSNNGNTLTLRGLDGDGTQIDSVSLEK